MARFTKDPDAVLDYVFDWSAWLDATDEIASHAITEDDGITVDSSTATSDAVTVWLSGGTAGEQYQVACLIVTNDGRTDERTATIMVRER